MKKISVQNITTYFRCATSYFWILFQSWSNALQHISGRCKQYRQYFLIIFFPLGKENVTLFACKFFSITWIFSNFEQHVQGTFGHITELLFISTFSFVPEHFSETRNIIVNWAIHFWKLRLDYFTSMVAWLTRRNYEYLMIFVSY